MSWLDEGRRGKKEAQMMMFASLKGDRIDVGETGSQKFNSWPLQPSPRKD